MRSKNIRKCLYIAFSVLLLLTVPALAHLNREEYEKMKHRLMTKPNGPEGYYICYEDGEDTGSAMIWWKDKQKTMLALEITAVFITGNGYNNTGFYEGSAPLKGNRATFFDIEGNKITLTFDGDTVDVNSSFEFDTNNGGFNVTFSGTYTRERRR